MDQQVRFCTAPDGTRVAYATLGSGPVLVKAANWLNHLEYDLESPVWRHWLRELSRDHTLVRYDERGCGLSDWNVKDHSHDAWVMDLEAVVDAAGVERFALLGISQGGPVAIDYAVRHPERVSHLILYGAYARGWKRRSSPEEIAEREAMITLSTHGWGRDMPTYREVFTRTFIPDANEEQRTWFNELQRITCSPENAVRLQREVGEVDVSHLLPLVTVPTLVLHARGDLRCPFDEARFLAASIPGSRFVSLDSRNHLLLEHEPAWATFLHEVRTFLGVNPEASMHDAVIERARPARERSFIQTLKDRKLVQWILAYLTAAWLGLQVLSAMHEPWNLPDWLLRAGQAVLGLGVVLTMVVAWYHGEKGQQRVTGGELLIIAGLLALAALLLGILIP